MSKQLQRQLEAQRRQRTKSAAKISLIAITAVALAGWAYLLID